METKYKKIYTDDYRKQFFDMLHKQNNLTIKECLKELRSLMKISRHLKIYMFVFTFEKGSIKHTVYENRMRINLNSLNGIDKSYYEECWNDYKNYLEQIGVIEK